MTVIAAVVLALVALSLPAAAEARSARKKICAHSATLRDTPRGFVIARLSRGQRVVVVRRSGARGWVPVRTSTGLPGWVLRRSLCGR
jgi:hypothetical protein